MTFSAFLRFLERIEDYSDPLKCWIWKASKVKGYGTVGINYRQYLAHRVSYSVLIGPIQDGLTLDHGCRTPSCVNPWHLEQVTQAENARRGKSYNAGKTHCCHGHEFTPENTAILRISGWRLCRACARNRSREYCKNTQETRRLP